MGLFHSRIYRRALVGVLCVVVLSLLKVPVASAGERRVALVIGNSAYENAPPLPNPRNDAQDFARALARLGFEVVEGIDLTRLGMEQSLVKFSRLSTGADAAVVFYAGHGLQYQGQNYLVPIDAKLEDEVSFTYEMLRLEDIVVALERAGGVRVLILDACRNNPFAERLSRMLSRSRDAGMSRGLAKLERTQGMIIAYATQANQVAADGKGRNSPFTTALLSEIERPGVEVAALFRRVALAVNEATSGKQTPELSLSVLGEFYFNRAETDQQAWQRLRNSTDSVALKDFITRFPDSLLVDVARSRLDMLERNDRKAELDKIIEEQAGREQRLLDQLARVEAERKRAADELAARQEAERKRAADELAARQEAEKLNKAPDETKTQERSRERPGGQKSERINLAALPVQPSAPPPCGAQSAARVDVSLREMRPLTDAEECALKPKQSFRECEKCPEMIVVPPGEAMVGSAKDEPGREAPEEPRHRVRIAKAFVVGRLAVTFDEWEACVADGGCAGYAPWDNGWGRGKRPVVNVSWNDAKNYVAWLSQKTGKSYRLLSESEREYVTRAGTSTPFWWGNSVTPRQANYNGQQSYPASVKGEYRQKTIAADALQPNPWGLYQVHGNIWEWVEDCLNAGYLGAPSDGAPWLSGDCERRVLRGGSWVSQPSLLRSAARYGVAREGRVGNVGFRVARSINQ